MRDLGVFPDGAFGLIVHPCSNLFVPGVRPVWREAFRVLRPGGVLLAGFLNPVLFLFDFAAATEEGRLAVKHSLPYSDLESLAGEEREIVLASGNPLEWSHSLEAQIGGQTEAGFRIAGLYEDGWQEETIFCRFFPSFLATRAVKP